MTPALVKAKRLLAHRELEFLRCNPRDHKRSAERLRKLREAQRLVERLTEREAS